MNKIFFLNKRVVARLIAVLILVTGLSLATHSSYAASATFTVDSTLDTPDSSINGVCDDGSGNCTLRAAIDEANATADADTINFSLTTGSTITSAGTFVITSPVAIDATSVSTCPTPGIVINGGNTSGDVFRLSGDADGSSIKGLVIRSYQTTTGVGIRLSSISGLTTTIACNIVGLNEDGTTASGGTSGIVLSASSNVLIGGPTTADRNIISGNRTVSSSSGIAIGGTVADAITIQGNYIGTNANGMAVNRNTSKGIGISGTTSLTNIVISSNLFAGKGIAIDNANGVNGVTIQKNTFNIAADGTTALTPVNNQVSAISFSNNVGAQNIQIGGSSLSGLGNTFGSYPAIGSVFATGTPGLTIQGNRIGVGASGESYPSWYGIILGGGSTDAKIGGTGAGEGNSIANTTVGGVLVAASPVYGIPTVTILGNSIYNNVGVGIDLAYDADSNQIPEVDLGANSNDLLDADTGANGYLNRPVIISATQSGGDVLISYMLDVPVLSYPYRVEFFSNDGSISTTRFGEGKTYEGFDVQTVGTAGQHVFTATLSSAQAADGITATVTECGDVGCTEYGATSEFSNGSTIGIDRGASSGSQSLFSDNGAYHIIKTGVYLGAGVVGDSNSSADTSDADGVVFTKASYSPSEEVSITVTASASGYINAWIDADLDGEFDTEIIPLNQSVAAGATVFSFTAPTGTGSYPVRFRYTDYLPTDLSAEGEAFTGEVEDYILVIVTDTPLAPSISVGKGRPWSSNSSNQVSDLASAINSISTSCSAADILSQNLRSGSRNGKYDAYTGTVVTQAHLLQKHLNRLGFNSGPTDGILGKLSDGAIKRLQKYLGAKADGYVGPITRALINKSCN